MASWTAVASLDPRAQAADRNRAADRPGPEGRSESERAAAGTPSRADRTVAAALAAVRLAFLSYTVDTAFLALFSRTGAVPASVPLGYCLAAVVVCGSALLLLRSGWTRRLADPTLAGPKIAAGAAIQLAGLAMAPQVGFVFLANLFTVFAFGVLRFTVAQFVVGWVLTTLATGVVMWGTAGRLGIPVSTPFEQLLVWLCFSATLARCIVLGIWASGLRAKLHRRARELAASVARVEELASRDDLTLAYNRRSFMVLLEDERNRALRTGASFSVALLDLDHFKSVNDRFGHAMGDAVLRGFAQAVRDTMRVTDRLGRYGGEEFILLLTATPAPAAGAAAERIRTAVADRDWSAAAGLVVTVSTGVAAYRPGETIEELIGRADAALYEAKRRGRNRVIVSP